MATGCEVEGEYLQLGRYMHTLCSDLLHIRLPALNSEVEGKHAKFVCDKPRGLAERCRKQLGNSFCNIHTNLPHAFSE